MEKCFFSSPPQASPPTWKRVLLNPAQQLLLWHVAELSDDAPLGLKVGEALDCHQSQYEGGGSLVFELFANPAKELSSREEEEKNRQSVVNVTTLRCAIT